MGGEREGRGVHGLSCTWLAWIVDKHVAEKQRTPTLWLHLEALAGRARFEQWEVRCSDALRQVVEVNEERDDAARRHDRDDVLAGLIDRPDVVVDLELLAVRVRDNLQALHVVGLHANQLRRAAFHAPDGRVQALLYVHCSRGRPHTVSAVAGRRRQRSWASQAAWRTHSCGWCDIACRAGRRRRPGQSSSLRTAACSAR